MAGIFSGRVLDQVSRETGVPLREIVSPSRSYKVVRARQAAMYALAKKTELSCKQIARAVGRTDHTTVLHGVRAHADREDIPTIDMWQRSSDIYRARAARWGD